MKDEQKEISTYLLLKFFKFLQGLGDSASVNYVCQSEKGEHIEITKVRFKMRGTNCRIDYTFVDSHQNSNFSLVIC